MRERLAFIDDPARLGAVPPGFAVVALDPFTLIATGMQARSLDEQLGDVELEDLGEQSFERVQALCAALGPTGPWRFQELKALYDTALALALGASRLVEETGAEEALLLVREDSSAAQTLPSVLERLGVQVRLELGATASPEPGQTQAASGRLASLWVGLRRAVRRRRPRVLLLDEHYSIPLIAAELRIRGAEVLLWLPPPSSPRVERTPDLATLAPLFRIGGVDLWPALCGPLQAFAERTLPLDAAAGRAGRAAIRRDRPDVLLASTYAEPAAKAAATAARAAGVPVVAARHGELAIRALPVMVCNDLDVADWMLCWGEWEERFVQRYAPRPVRTAVVGAPMIEDLAAPSREEIRRRLGIAHDALVVLLAPTALSADEWFIGRRQPLDTGYVRHQVALVEQLLSLDGVELVAKEHASGAGPLEVWARTSGAPLTFLHSMPFSELVNLADATVLDFASTTLVQALRGSSRLFVVLHPITAWEPEVIEHLEAYGVHFAAPERLAETLRADLARSAVVHPLEAVEPLLASGPGTAAQRAADAVLHIVSEQPATTIESR